MHLIDGLTELRIHQLFVDFILRTGPEENAAALRYITDVQAERLIELARSVAATPNRAVLAAALLTYPTEIESWKDAGREILLENGGVVGSALIELGRYADARPWFERAVAAAEKGDVHGRIDHASLGVSLHLVGYCLSSTGQFADARPWSELAVAAKEKGDVHGRVDHASLAVTLRLGAQCLQRLGLVQESNVWDERAASLR